MPKKSTAINHRPKPTQRPVFTDRAIRARAKLCQESAERMYLAELLMRVDNSPSVYAAWERASIDMQTAGLFFDEAPLWIISAREKVEALWEG